MIQYILECIAFQLVFLLIYDLFLKRETFFQWNRIYLIITYLLSMVLPWVRIEALTTEVPSVFQGYPEYLWNINDVAVSAVGARESGLQLSWPHIVFISGVVLAALFFAYKLFKIYMLRKKGKVYHYKDFTKIIISNSSLAFSFFKSIFLGDQVSKKEHQSILDHELVHIHQKHSYDLLFFELMRIVGWFNPLVYVYQNRISELHEFIADAKVAKTKRKEQYELLLSQVFQTQNISFINQFFKSSLIKKRIVMLQKTKSKKIFQLKYLVLVPILIGMLFYTSLEGQEINENKRLTEQTEDDIQGNKEFDEGADAEKKYLQLVNERDRLLLNSNDKNSVIVELDKQLVGLKKAIVNDKEAVPFSKVDKVPIFPGCEDSDDTRACFQQKIMRHVSKNFSYPMEAQQKGLQGRVSIMFTMNAEGSTVNIKVRGPHKLLEDEAVRIISKLPKMSPGKHKGEVVGVTYSLPITFVLDTDKKELKEEKITSGIPFGIVDKVPVFPGCENEENKRACFNTMIQEHISKNFNYPQEAQEKGIQGKVNLMFIIGKDGVIKNLRMRGPDKLLEDEAKRIIMRLPDMKPGRHEGKNVDVPFSIPISFRLESNAVENDVSPLGLSFKIEPVYYIDGKESSKELVNMLNPDDIESMSVLKSEVAKNVYGEKGKNGVITIITKKKD